MDGQQTRTDGTPAAGSPFPAKIAALVQQGQLAAAADELEAICARRPGDVASRLQLAMVRRQMGDVEPALETLSQAIGKCPEHPDLHYFTAMILAEVDRDEEALSSLARTLELDPEHWNARVLSAMLWMRRGRCDEAADAYRQANGLGTDEPDLCLYLGLSYAAASDRIRSTALFRQVAERQHASVNTLAHPCLSPDGGGKASTQPDPLATILGVFQNDPKVMEVLADLPRPPAPEPKWTQLSGVCTELANRNPDYPDVQYSCGRMLSRLGHEDEGVERMKRAVVLNGGFDKARDALAEHEHQPEEVDFDALDDDGTADDQGRDRPVEVDWAVGGSSLADWFGDFLHETAEAPLQALRKLADRDTDDARSQNALAVKLMLLGRQEDAAQQFKHSLRQCGDSVPALVGRAMMLCGLGRADEASELFGRAARLKPDVAEFPYWQGMVEEMGGRTEAAVSAYRKAVGLDDDHADALERLAACEAGRGNALEARRLYQCLVERMPEHLTARAALARLLAGEGQANEAMQQYRHLLRRQPGNWQARSELADVLQSMGLGRQAGEQMGIVADQRPDDPAVHLRFGRMLLRLGETTAALERFEQAIALDPTRVNAWLGSAHARLDQRNFSGAITAYRQVLCMRREDSDAMLGMGLAQARSGRIDQAVQTLSQLGKRRSGELVARLAAKILRKAMRDFSGQKLTGGVPQADPLVSDELLADGIAQLNEAVDSNPDYGDLHYRLAVLQQNMGLEDQALFSLRKALSVDPGHEDSMLRLARLYADRGELAQARRILQAAIAKRPTYPDLHRQLGELYARGGEFEEAIGRFEAAVEQNPGYLEGHASLAEALEQTGQQGRARESWQKVLKLESAGLWVARARKQLARLRPESA